MGSIASLFVAFIVGLVTALVIIGPKLPQLAAQARRRRELRPVARGKYLSRMAHQYGLKRRLFESDDHLRDRILRVIKTPQHGRGLS